MVDNKHIDPNYLGTAVSNEGLTSLLLALKKKKKEIVQLLLDRAGMINMPNMDLTTKDPRSGATPLYLAISNEYETIHCHWLLGFL